MTIVIIISVTMISINNNNNFYQWVIFPRNLFGG